MDENGINEIDDHVDPDPPQPISDGAGIPWAGILVVIWAVALIIFSVQNAEHTTVEFLGWSFDMPVALLVMVTALVTLVFTGMGSAIYRRRRRKRREATRVPESDV